MTILDLFKGGSASYPGQQFCTRGQSCFYPNLLFVSNFLARALTSLRVSLGVMTPLITTFGKGA